MLRFGFGGVLTPEHTVSYATSARLTINTMGQEACCAAHKRPEFGLDRAIFTQHGQEKESVPVAVPRFFPFSLARSCSSSDESKSHYWGAWWALSFRHASHM
jgi:hypothetical protein